MIGVARQEVCRAFSAEDSVDLVRKLCRSALTCREDFGLLAAMERVCWDTLMEVMGHNRLWSACAVGFPSNTPMPRRFAHAVKQGRGRAMLMNSRTMATARLVVPLLWASSIPAIVFKGPVFHHQLHGDYFFRLSSDLDLLVPRRDFAAALEILKNRGFAPKDGDDGHWWRNSLGELHLVHPDRSQCVIDLHYRVQQPGCPAPRHMEEFIVDPVVQEIGREFVATLCPEKALVLSCISLVKGLVHHEPSGKHAFDVAVGLMKLDGGQRGAFLAIARRQGLLNTVVLAAHATESVFDIHLPIPGELRPESGSPISSMPLVDMVLRPHHEQLEWPRRRALLWAMCDGESTLAKSARFAQEAARAAKGELQRVLTIK